MSRQLICFSIISEGFIDYIRGVKASGELRQLALEASDRARAGEAGEMFRYVRVEDGDFEKSAVHMALLDAVGGGVGVGV